MSRDGVLGVNLLRHTHTQVDIDSVKHSDRLEDTGYRAWERTLTADMDLDSVQTACRANCQSYYTANKECNKYQLIKSNWIHS